MAFGYLTILNGFTVELWMQQNGAPGTDYAALWTQSTQADASWGTTGTTKGRQIWFGLNAAGTLYLDVWDKSGVQRVSWVDPTPQNVIDNEWHHLAVRLASDKRTFTIFLNGLSIATATSAVDLVWDTGSFVIGGHYQPKFGAYGIYLWRGKLAYFAAKDAALTSNRIAEHYAAGNGGAVYYGDTEVTRIHRILDWANVPTQSRQFDPALVNMQGIDVTNANALDKVLEAGEAATGYVFADGQTKIIYHNRRRRYNKYSVFTFAESLGTAPESDIEYAIDDSWVYNDVRGDRPFGSTIRIIDQHSVDTYGRKVYKITLPITSHEVLRNAVGWLLSKYKTDHVRVDSITIEVGTSDAMLPAGTGRIQIGDHITLDELPGHAPLTTMEFIVEGINLSADFKNKLWKVSFNLSPAEYERVFEIGVSSLGSGDRIAY